MKKLLFIATIALSLSLCGCVPKKESPIHEKYAAEIQTKLQSTEFYYTYQECYPKSEDEVYVIDFYSFAPSASTSVWICENADGYISCKMLKITHHI